MILQGSFLLAFANALDGFQRFSAVSALVRRVLSQLISQQRQQIYMECSTDEDPHEPQGGPGMLGAVAKDQPSSDDRFRHPIDSKGTQTFECLRIPTGVMRIAMAQMAQQDDFIAAKSINLKAIRLHCVRRLTRNSAPRLLMFGVLMAWSTVHYRLSQRLGQICRQPSCHTHVIFEWWLYSALLTLYGVRRCM